MRREDAIKKLTKLLGKKLGYRVDPKAPDADERAEARAQLPASNAKHEELRKLKDARFRAILDGDEEYQRLKAEYAEAQLANEKLLGTLRHYRFTAGVLIGPFFTVKAQGDSWEEVIAKIAKKEHVS